MSRGGRRTGWKRTEEKIPPTGENVLVCGPLGGIYLARWWRGSFTVYPEKQKWFDWWMPLPEPPDEVEEAWHQFDEDERKSMRQFSSDTDKR